MFNHLGKEKYVLIEYLYSKAINLNLVLKHLRIKKGNRTEIPILSDNQFSVAVHLHIFHEEYLDKVIRCFRNDENAFLYISVPTDKFRNKLESELTKVGKLDVRIVPNKGRNFAPLFVEFGEELGKFDLVLHLHSKSHQNSFKRKRWAKSLWNHLLIDKKSLEAALSLFNERTNLGLYYSRDFRWYPHSIGWSGTEAKSKFHFPELAIEIDKAKALRFPVGGMFLTRGTNISYISKVINSWDYFPPEAVNTSEISQGLTLEHSLERLIAQVNLHNGFDTLVYDCNYKSFIIEAGNVYLE